MTSPRGTVQRIMSGAALASIVKLLGVGISFLFTLGVARLLSAQEFGIFAAGLSLSIILGAVGTVGQHTAVVRFWPSFDEVHGQQVATRAIQRSLGVSALGCATLVAGGAVLMLVNFQIDSFGSAPCVWLAIGALASAITLSEVTLSALRAQGFVLLAFVPRDILWRSTALAVLGLGLLPLGPLVSLSITAGVLWALTLVQLVLLHRQSPNLWQLKELPPLPHHELLSMRHAQWGFWGNAVLNPLQQQGGTVIVALTLGPLEAGAFFAASRLANLLAIVQTGANQISGPMMARSWRAKKIGELKSVADLTALLATFAAVAGLIGFVFLGQQLLALFNPEYSVAYIALLILCTSQVVATYCGPNGMLLLMTGFERKFLTVKLYTILFGLLTTAVLATALGLTGAALGAALGLASQNILGALVCKRHVGIGPVLSLAPLQASGATRKDGKW